MVRPSAFAVLRLTTSSNFVGCSMGRSAGLKHRRQLFRDEEAGEVDTVRHRRALGKDDHRVRLRAPDRLERLPSSGLAPKGD